MEHQAVYERLVQAARVARALQVRELGNLSPEPIGTRLQRADYRGVRR